jgi:hypothetical protein
MSRPDILLNDLTVTPTYVCIPKAALMLLVMASIIMMFIKMLKEIRKLNLKVVIADRHTGFTIMLLSLVLPESNLSY